MKFSGLTYLQYLSAEAKNYFHRSDICQCSTTVLPKRCQSRILHEFVNENNQKGCVRCNPDISLSALNSPGHSVSGASCPKWPRMNPGFPQDVARAGTQQRAAHGRGHWETGLLSFAARVPAQDLLCILRSQVNPGTFLLDMIGLPSDEDSIVLSRGVHSR